MSIPDWNDELKDRLEKEKRLTVDGFYSSVNDGNFAYGISNDLKDSIEQLLKKVAEVLSK